MYRRQTKCTASLTKKNEAYIVHGTHSCQKYLKKRKFMKDLKKRVQTPGVENVPKAVGDVLRK